MMVAPVVISFAVTLAFMLALRPVAIATGLIDHPGGRKDHVGAIPVVGGLAMFAGICFGVALIPGVGMEQMYLLLTALLLVVIGVLDDRYGLPASVRLVAHTSAVIIMAYAAGLLMTQIGNPLWLGTIWLGPLAFPITVLITVSVINSFNFVDGVDGLAGSLAVIALGALFLTGGLDPVSTLVTGVVVAAIVGFLVFNFPLSATRALRAFMGDTGSTLLGMTIVWLTIGVSQGDVKAISPVIGLWFAAIPVYDFFTCMVRRVMKGKSPFKPGREHFHHMLFRAGFSARQVLALLTGLGAVYAAFGLIGHFTGVHDSLMFTLWAIVGLTQYTVLKYVAVRVRGLQLRKMREST